MQNRFGLLDTDVMPMIMIISLDIFIIMSSSINCSALICSPIVLFDILREATSETYGPRVFFPSYEFSFPSYKFYFPSDWFPIYYFAIFYFLIYKPKIPKIFILPFIYLYHISPFASNREEIDNPFIALGASCWLFVQVLGDLCVVSYWIDTLVLKLREILTLLYCITLSSSREKPTQAQEVAFHIIVIISTISIRSQGFIIIKFTWKGKVWSLHPSTTGHRISSGMHQILPHVQSRRLHGWT